jgi:hypothetical protein
MAKRYYQSKRDRRDERSGMLRHNADKFNDETHHSAEPERSGPYPYDRQSLNGYDPRMRSDSSYGLQGSRYDRPDNRYDRMSERDGYRNAGVNGEYYAGAEPRRRQEMEDAGMIHEDRRRIANLPQEVMIRPYPMTGPYMPETIDDTIRGVDRQMDYDDNKRREHFFPKKV